MDVYTSENEQVEALRRWWEKNGRAAIIAFAVVIAAVLGFRAWQEHKNARAAEASAIYQQMLEQEDPAAVLESGRSLLANYGDTAYASLASLAMAAASVQQNDLDAAAGHLRAAMDAAKIPGIRQAAAVRLARVLLSQGKAKEALAVLDGTDPTGLRGAVEEARGDAQLALGDTAAARQAYQNALAAYGDVPTKQNLL
ncbi:MAG: YfgM family protein, partial [Thiohalomonadaceae bacterium]